VIGRFIVDFYCASAKLAIELDGAQHFDDCTAAYETERTKILSEHGVYVIRFSNYEVDRHVAGVCEKIQSEVMERGAP
jgi:very-short-patch-repair endonuclease